MSDSSIVRSLGGGLPSPLRGPARVLWRGGRRRLARLLGRGREEGAAAALKREERAIEAGQAAYAAALRAERGASFLMRRNVHRIEKGLITTPRRRVFATDFIGETVGEYEAVVRGRGGRGAGPELAWARDVLTRYFAETDPEDPTIAAARRRFEGVPRPGDALAAPVDLRAAPGPAHPFRRQDGAPPVAIEALSALAARRRSVRSYRPEPVPREVVERAVAVAAQSPSACNRQAFSMLFFDDPETARRVGRVPAGTKTFVDGMTGIAVIVGHLRAYPRARDRHAIYVDGGLAAMALILALEAQGVGTCAINWSDEEPAESRIKGMLGLRDDDRVVMMMSYGWPDPDAEVPFSAKRPVAELAEWNRELRA